MPQVKVDYEFDDYQSLVQSAKAKVKKRTNNYKAPKFRNRYE